jgi:hypothetical protein
MSLAESTDTTEAEAMKTEPETPTTTTTTTEVQGWFYDEGKPGEGERPEWLNPKYKTAAEQAKAYNEAQKKLGAFKGAPEEYTIELEGEEYQNFQLDKDNPILQDFLKDAKENGVSQDYVNKMLKTYASMQMQALPNKEQEFEKLGPNGKQDIQVLAQWGSNNLTQDEFKQFKNMMTTADSVRLFEKIINRSTKAETSPQTTTIHRESEAEIMRMIHDPRYDKDPVFRDQVRAKLASIQKG